VFIAEVRECREDSGFIQQNAIEIEERELVVCFVWNVVASDNQETLQFNAHFAHPCTPVHHQLLMTLNRTPREFDSPQPRSHSATKELGSVAYLKVFPQCILLSSHHFEDSAGPYLTFVGSARFIRKSA